MNNGIVLIALGYPLYGFYAYNMAISLKAYDKDIRVCLLYEPSAIQSLTEKELSFFDHKILVPESHYTVNGTKQYQRAKLTVNRLSPFDFTIYMDVDGIWFPGKKPTHLLGEVINKEFTIGLNAEYNVRTRMKSKQGYIWWGDCEKICKYWGIKEYMMQTVSGFYSFHKTDRVNELFNTALRVYDDANDNAMKWANGKADEYCFNVAMGLVGMRQDQFHVFYFDKLNGIKPEPWIYDNFWGLAIGGVKVSEKVVILYNKLVNKCSMIKGMLTRHYHVEKSEVIPERKKI
jgi:hypothetical protein